MRKENQTPETSVRDTSGASQLSQEFGLDLSSQEFGSDLTSQEFGNSLASQEFGLDLSSQEFGSDLASQEFGNSLASQEFGSTLPTRPHDRDCSSEFTAADNRFNRCSSPCSTRRQELERPLRVIHVGQHMVQAGIEMWLKGFIQNADPRRLKFERCIVTSTFNDPQVIREMPCPVEIGGEASVRQAAKDCDVLLVSGPGELADWIVDIHVPLSVFVAHGDGIWTKQILNRCLPVIDHVVAVSRRVQSLTCQDVPSTVIYNGIDTSHLTRSEPRENVRARFGFGPDDFVVGSVMRLSPEKRPELLVEAISKLPRNFKLLLVGWGPLQQKLFDLANRIAPARCVITPAHSNLGDYYSAFDAFCLPSDSEGFGLATLEAQFCGVPTVTTDSGFAPELLQDRVQYVQCSGNADSIADSMSLLANHPAWTRGLAAEGKLAAESFGFAQRMYREYEELLIRLWLARTVQEETNATVAI